MENVIEHIVGIDQKARQKIEEAYLQKNSILLQAEEEEEVIKLDAIAKANHHVVGVEACEKAKVEEKIVVISIQTSETIKSLNDIYQSNHIKWEADIFNNIINKN